MNGRDGKGSAGSPSYTLSCAGDSWAPGRRMAIKANRKSKVILGSTSMRSNHIVNCPAALVGQTYDFTFGISGGNITGTGTLISAGVYDIESGEGGGGGGEGGGGARM